MNKNINNNIQNLVWEKNNLIINLNIFYKFHDLLNYLLIMIFYQYIRKIKISILILTSVF